MVVVVVVMVVVSGASVVLVASGVELVVGTNLIPGSSTCTPFPGGLRGVTIGLRLFTLWA